MELPDLSLIDISQLPHSLQALVDCIGIDNAYQLTCAYGGRPKYIPKYRERTKLADVLPAEALDALIKRFAGVALEIPKLTTFCASCVTSRSRRKAPMAFHAACWPTSTV